MIQVRAGTFFTHIIGWLILLLLPLLFITGQNQSAGISQVILSPWYWLFLLCYASIFYSHTYFLFPSLYSHKKYLLYFICLAAFFAIIIFLSPFDRLVGFGGRPPHFSGERPPDFRPRDMRPPRKGGRVDIVSIILYFLTLALSIAVITSRQLRRSQERTLQAETKKAQAELSYLKAQINPHFLFNTLNNIYALASTQHDNTAPAVLKLSNILRYVTEEISDDFVPLEKEVDCVKNYIDLQQLRLSKTKIDFGIDGDMSGVNIPPMVLMTYIENAFKFGVSNHEESVIEIKISAKDGVIDFYCRNKVFESGSKERTGIGLQNTKQRLDYLYSSYGLDAGIADGYYTVKLRIIK